MASKFSARIRINFAGDVMIGRLIDQLLPTSVRNDEEAEIVRQFRRSRASRAPYLQDGKYKYETVWGNTIPLWKQGHLNIINLETSMTNHNELWPNKVFNYRSHPDNVACLLSANIHHVSLANNHTLDFGIIGLQETCETLDRSGISYVGAGKTRERALGPVFLDIPLHEFGNVGNNQPVLVHRDTPRSPSSLRVALLSASDHPSDWSTIDSFHLLPRYNQSSLYSHLVPLISSARANADLVIFSVHWGPNYQWIPDKSIENLGKWLINEGVDIIHGHSSHHIQGVEVIERSDKSFGLIIYGCSDFVDDYAIDEQYRNDLGALFQLDISIHSSTVERKKSIAINTLSIFPTRCSNFQVNRLSSDDIDWKWITEKMEQLSHVRGRTWTIGNQNELILPITP